MNARKDDSAKSNGGATQKRSASSVEKAAAPAANHDRLEAYPTKIRRTQIVLYLLVPVCLLTAGAVMGTLLGTVGSPPMANPEHPTSSPGSEMDGESTPFLTGDSLEASPSPEVTGPDVAGGLQQIDMWIREDQPAQAMQACSQLAEQMGSPIHEEIHFRLALTAEAAGEHVRAHNAWQELIKSAAEPRVRDMARLADARILFRQRRFAQARAILYPLILNAHHQDASIEVVESAAHLLAQVNSEEVFFVDRTLLRLEDERSIAHGQLFWLPARDLETWMSPRSVPGPLDRWHASPHVAARLPESATSGKEAHVSLSRMTVFARSARLYSILQIIAGELQLQLELTPRHQAELEAQTVDLAIDDIGLPQLLDGLLDARSYGWRLVDGKLWVQPLTQFAREELLSLRRRSAEHSCQYAGGTYPGHYAAAATLLYRGNLLFAANEYGRAIADYQDLLREHSTANLRQTAWFNLAKAYYRTQQINEALDAYYHVVDEATRGPLESIAYLWLGRIQMERQEWKGATRELTRALSLVQDETQLVAGLFTLATVYILMDNPHAASMTLMEYRDRLTASPHQDSAALISSLAAFRGADDPQEVDTSGRRLSGLVVRVSPRDYFGPVGYVLTSRALQSLGLVEQRVTVLEQALRNMNPSPLRDSLQLELCRDLLEFGPERHAIEQLKQLTAQEGHASRRAATLMLAEYYLQQGKTEECHTAVVAMLKDTTEPEEKVKLLRLAGQAYQRTGKYYEAAVCFAGMIPHETR